MNIFSHIIMGQMLYKSLRKNNIKVQKNSFIFGNIKPDFSSEHKRIPHYKKDNFDFFKKKVNEFINTELECRFEYNSELSVKLGVICHYISDFFCFAHNEGFKNTMWNHFLYELKLYFYMQKNIKSIRKIKRKIDCNKYFSTDKLFEELDLSNMEYLKSYKSKGMDVMCSMQNCMNMILALVNTAKVFNNNNYVEVADYEDSLLYGHVLS